MKIIFFTYLVFLQYSLFGQNNEIGLLDSVSKHSHFIVFKKAFHVKQVFFHVYQDSIIFLNRTQIRHFLPLPYQKEFYAKLENQNEKEWAQNDFKNKILVESLKQNITITTINRKSDLSITKDIRREIRKYNRSKVNLRRVSYISRPVFSNDFIYAIIQIDSPYGSMGGGGEILLFEQIHSIWHYQGNIASWTY